MFTLILLVITILMFTILYVKDRRLTTLPPGPFGLPLLGYLPFLTEYLHKNLVQLSKKYGEIFSIRMGSFGAVVLSSLKSIKLALKEETFSGRPRLPLYIARSEGKGILFSDGYVWSETRRFTIKTLKDFGFGKTTLEGIIKSEILEFLNIIRASEGQPIQLRNSVNLSVVNALWTIVAGKRFCQQNDADAIQMIYELSEVIREMTVGSAIEFLPWLPRIGFLKKQELRVLENIQRLKNIMERIVEKHIKDHVDGQDTDFIHVYLNTMNNCKDPKSPFHGQEGFGNLVILLTDLFSTGMETTSTTILWTVLIITTYPEVQRKMQAEVDGVMQGDAKPPNNSHRNLMPYTEAVLMEVVRFVSLVPLSVLHRTTKNSNFMGYDIPADTLVIPNLYQVLQDPEHWERPTEFYPEHFLTENGTLKIPEAFVAFGEGKHNCPGEILAKMELFLFITSLVQNFEFEFPANLPKPTLKPVPGIVCMPQSYSVIARSRKN